MDKVTRWKAEFAGDVIGREIDFDKSLAIDSAYQVLSFQLAKRGIGIDQIGKRRERGQGGKGDPRRPIATADPLSGAAAN